MNAQPISRLSLVKGSGPVTRRAGTDALLASAVSEVLVMISDESSWQINALRRVRNANLRNGVRCRVLAPDSARLSNSLSALALTGAEVRTDTDVPIEALVIDRTSVLLSADRTESQAGEAVLRLPGVVNGTFFLFERIWQAAVPLTPLDVPDSVDASMLTRRERDLLALLWSGSTDESAAARLGISVRTVRRMVADIMNRLGARSRFQAGAKAAGRGWLMEEAV